VFPAINLVASGTRKEELLLTGPALVASNRLRQRIARMSPLDAMNDLLTDLRRHKTNAELIETLTGTEGTKA
jgi:transcription termination factor Rho